MKQRTIDRLLDEGNVQAFEFGNDDYMVFWAVTPGHGKLVARRIVQIEDSGEEYVDYLQVPYANVDACEDVYNAIIDDFVDCYGEALFCGDADELALFSDYAGPTDDSLIALLSVFGKEYYEFLLDVFFAYSDEVLALLSEDEDDDEDYCDEDCDCYCDDEDSKEDARLTRKVLRHLGEATLFIDYRNGNATYWEFARANGEIWYRRADLCFDDDEMVYYDEYGHFCVSNLDAAAALRDMVLSCFKCDDFYYEDEGDALGLVGLSLDDIDDE